MVTRKSRTEYDTEQKVWTTPSFVGIGSTASVTLFDKVSLYDSISSVPKIVKKSMENLAIGLQRER